MRISQMKQRENFDDILIETLSRGWSEQFGHSVELFLGSASAPGDAQSWRLQPLLSMYCAPEPTREAREFLRDSFRFSPFFWRIIPQWILGTAATTRLGLRFGGQQGFGVTPAIENADAMVLLPGNQRIRVFDFARARVRTFLKAGFDNRTMQTEIGIRSQVGPFTPIVAHDPGFTWFEEPILAGYDLTRCPPWFSKKRLVSRAFSALENWAERSSKTVAASTYIESLVDKIETAIDAIKKRFSFAQGDFLHRTVEALMVYAQAAEEIVVQGSHGDFQPGNIRVNPTGKKVWLLDWEHAGRRSEHYDRVVFGLKTRASHGLAARAESFVEGDDADGLFAAFPSSQAWRRSQLAVVLIEDLLWYLAESLTGPTRDISQGLSSYLDELRRLMPRLATI